MILCPLRGRRFRVSQWYGARPEVYKIFGHDGHNGIDFTPLWLIPKGRKITVYAPHDGYVTLGDQQDRGYGRYVRIKSLSIDNQGYQRQSQLAHLEGFYGAHNSFVHSGEPVGYLVKGKTTGFSTDTHLHWTYKVLLEGKIAFPNNGYNGASDVSRLALIWTSRTLR